MRNALVVLVPLCIGLTSGFIVPSGIQEILIDDLGNINFDLVTDVESSTSASKTLNIDNSRIKTLDKDLYIDANKKDLNINERSFIYIKQKTKKPLQNLIFLNIIPKERIDDNKTDTSYLLNRNNGFEEFPRRFSIGHMYIDKPKINDNFNLNKSKHQCNTQTENDIYCNKSLDSKSKHNYFNRVNKEQKQKLVSNVIPLKSNLKNFANVRTVMLKPNIQDNHDVMFTKQRILDELSDKATYALGYFERKSSYAMDNHKHEKFYLSKGNKQNNIVGIDREKLVTKAFVDRPIERKSNSRLDPFGLYYCRVCHKKLAKQNLKNPLFIKKKCKCRHENALRNHLYGNI